MNDSRPWVAYLLGEISSGDQCRLVVQGWKDFDQCAALKAKNPEAACPLLDQTLQRIRDEADKSGQPILQPEGRPSS